MKRILIFTYCLILTLNLCACKQTKNVSSDTSTAEVSSQVHEDAASDSASSQIQSTQSVPEAVVSQPQVYESSAVSKTQNTASPEPTVSSAPVTSVATPTAPVTSKYTVVDPENTRGLSNQKFGFGFGIAENGVAHSLSFSNQAKFDGMANVEALALDTKSTDKRMYLTFDCGYEYQNLTAAILDTLKAKNVKAAFFVTLSYIKNNPLLVKRMINEGHIVGNHSATHPSFPTISRTKMAEELFLVDDYLQKNFGYKNKYFRFPAGEHSENSLELVSSLGYKSVFWSSAYRDYDTANQNGYDVAFKTVTDRFHQGAVILLHAVSQDNADILGAVIDNAHSQGYTFKTLDDYYVN